jgi:hypothetical protein
MSSSGMLHFVAFVRTDVLEGSSVSIIRVTRIGDLGRTLAVTNNTSTLRRNSIKSHYFANCLVNYRHISLLGAHISYMFYVTLSRDVSADLETLQKRVYGATAPRDQQMNSHCILHGVYTAPPPHHHTSLQLIQCLIHVAV